jgi:hypothetical protein
MPPMILDGAIAAAANLLAAACVMPREAVIALAGRDTLSIKLKMSFAVVEAEAIFSPFTGNRRSIFNDCHKVA